MYGIEGILLLYWFAILNKLNSQAMKSLPWVAWGWRAKMPYLRQSHQGNYSSLWPALEIQPLATPVLEVGVKG
jgi:hypothetical protein